MPENEHEPRVGLRVLRRGATNFEYEPIADDAVVRFRLGDGDAVTVQLKDGALILHHESDFGTRSRMAVRPEVSNVLSVIVVKQEG